MATKKQKNEMQWADVIGDMWQCPNCGERDFTEGIEDDQDTVWCGGCGTRLKIDL